jgi:hypothetical protein
MAVSSQFRKRVQLFIRMRDETLSAACFNNADLFVSILWAQKRLHSIAARNR